MEDTQFMEALASIEDSSARLRVWCEMVTAPVAPLERLLANREGNHPDRVIEQLAFLADMLFAEEDGASALRIGNIIEQELLVKKNNIRGLVQCRASAE